MFSLWCMRLIVQVAAYERECVWICIRSQKIQQIVKLLSWGHCTVQPSKRAKLYFSQNFSLLSFKSTSYMYGFSISMKKMKFCKMLVVIAILVTSRHICAIFSAPLLGCTVHVLMILIPTASSLQYMVRNAFLKQN